MRNNRYPFGRHFVEDGDEEEEEQQHDRHGRLIERQKGSGTGSFFGGANSGTGFGNGFGAGTGSSSGSASLVSAVAASSSTGDGGDLAAATTTPSVSVFTYTTDLIMTTTQTLRPYRFTSVPPSWEAPERSVWFQQKTIFIVSIFLAIFIVLFIGATVFLRDRRYDVDDDETDEQAILRIMEGRGKEQEKRLASARRVDARDGEEDGGGGGAADDGGDAAAAAAAADPALDEKEGDGGKVRRGLRKPATRWIRATAGAGATAYAFLRHGKKSRRSANGSINDSSSSRGQLSSFGEKKNELSSSSIERTRTYSTDSRRAAGADGNGAIAGGRASTDSRGSLRSGSASITGSTSSGAHRRSAGAQAGLRQRRAGTRRPPRLGNGEGERVEISYDDPPPNPPSLRVVTSGSSGLGSADGAAPNGSSNGHSRPRGGSSGAEADDDSFADAPPPSGPSDSALLPPPSASSGSNGSSAGRGVTLDTSDITAADAHFAGRTGVVGGEELGEEAFPPAYLSATQRASLSAAPGQTATGAAAATAAALAAAATTEQKVDAAIELSRSDVQGSSSAPQAFNGAGSSSLAMMDDGSSGGEASSSNVAHIATDEKSLLASLSAGASQPSRPAVAEPDAAPLYESAPAQSSSAPPHVPTAPELDLDHEGFEQLDGSASEDYSSPSRPSAPSDSKSGSGKGKAPSFLPAPPQPTAPAFSPFDQPYSPAWPPRQGQPMPSAPSRAPSQRSVAPSAPPPPAAEGRAAGGSAAKEKEREAAQERALIASAPSEFAAMTPGATLPAYNKLTSEPTAPTLDDLSDHEHTPTAPPFEFDRSSEEEEDDDGGQAHESPQPHSHDEDPSQQQNAHRRDADGVPRFDLNVAYPSR